MESNVEEREVPMQGEPVPVEEETEPITVVSNGPSEDAVKKLKEDHGDLEAIDVGGDLYIYRRLNRAEFKLMQEENRDKVNKEGFDPDEDLVERLLVWPEYHEVRWSNRGAGTVGTLARYMMAFSGFSAAQPVRL